MGETQGDEDNALWRAREEGVEVSGFVGNAGTEDTSLYGTD